MQEEREGEWVKIRITSDNSITIRGKYINEEKSVGEQCNYF
jgi:hypothetical protein